MDTPGQHRARVAICGTAKTWVETPWDDPGITIWGLNDGYAMVDAQGQPMRRAEGWFDLHPFEKMWFRPKDKKVFREGEIPEGVYVRPEGHVEWLREKARTIPVWLQTVPAGWPVQAQRFPFETVKAFLKARPDQESYIASSPVQMLAFAILQGYTEIVITGIHLETQAEYLKQRPNMEWLLGRAHERGITIVLPTTCPLLKHSHVYGYEPEPVRPDAAARRRLAEAQRQYSSLTVRVAGLSRWQSRTAVQARLTRLKAEIADAQMQARHAMLTAGGG
jgi:hypothetical protein